MVDFTLSILDRFRWMFRALKVDYPIFRLILWAKLTVTGQSAHGSTPDKGINALDAMIVMFSSIGVLRQQLRDDARVHGIITHGGDASNIIPKYTSARLGVRANPSQFTKPPPVPVRPALHAGHPLLHPAWRCFRPRRVFCAAQLL